MNEKKIFEKMFKETDLNDRYEIRFVNQSGTFKKPKLTVFLALRQKKEMNKDENSKN